jgi:hypothetical protein
MSNYYLLFPTTRNTESADPEWRTNALASFMCKECYALPRTGKIADVVIQGTMNRKSSMNYH